MGFTREQIKQIFPESTDSQISEILNQYHAEMEKIKKKDAESKAKEQENKEKTEALEQEKIELEKKLAEIEDGKLSEIEKANKTIEAANQRIAELEKAQFVMNMRSDAMAKFKITAEQAKDIISESGSFDMEKLGNIISEKESAAALAKEQEIARLGSNPNGQNGNQNENSFASDLAIASAKASKSANQSIIDMYKR